jgi:signal transduction histidine kinase
MNAVIKDTFKISLLLHNLHFWVICCIMFILIVFYNASYLHVTNLFSWLRSILEAKGVYALVFGFLFLIPILYASALFKIKGAIISWSIFLLAILPKTVLEMASFTNLLIVALFAVSALSLSLLTALESNLDARGRVIIKKTKNVRWRYLARLIKINEAEREYLARKLHDNIIQSLLVIANRVHHVETNDDLMKPETKKSIEKLQTMLLHVIDDVRRLSHGLRGGVLDNIGLLPVLRWQVERISQESGIKLEVKVNGLEHRLSPEVEVIMYKIVQEALHNIAQHSKASSGSILLDFVSDYFKLVIQDNGQGFRIPKNIDEFSSSGKFGLDRMRKQTALLDGSIDIRSEPGQGTIITVISKL